MKAKTMTAALALVGSLALSAPAPALHYTDIWWAQNGSEPGWGVNLAQNAGTIFATFFVYGQNREPFWYTATLHLQPNGSFTGDLFRTEGPWFGTVPFNPQTVIPTPVGRATFTPTSSTTARLDYNVGSTPVSKTIERQPLAPIDFSGSYSGRVYGPVSGCSNPADNETLDDSFSATVTQTGSELSEVTMDIVSADGTNLRLQGTRTQKGWVSNIPNATLSIAGGATSAVVEDLVPTGTGLEMRLTFSEGGGCTSRLRIAAVKKN